MNFWKAHSSLIMKLVINQIGIVIFSMVLNLAVANAWGGPYLVWVSLFSTLFYLFLIYTVMWEQGSKDVIRMDAGRMERDSFLGAKIALWASIPNGVIWILLLLGAVLSIWNGTLYNICVYFVCIWEGMYYGAAYNLALLFAKDFRAWGTVLCYLALFFLMPLCSHIAYVRGMKNKRLFGGKSKPAA